MKISHPVYYLDNASTTPVLSEICEDFKNRIYTDFGNPSSVHKMGLEAERILDKSRERIAKSFSCSPDWIFFTSGATESNNWAVHSAWETRKRRGTVLLASEGDHPSIITKLKSMQNRGAQIQLVRLNKNGIMDLEHLNQLLSSQVIFLSILWVNNETGVIQPVSEIIHMTRKKAPHCVIHLDAVQAFGKIKNDTWIEGTDLCSLSAHKIGGLKGTGALVTKNNFPLIPFLLGGNQEKSKRAGTENTLGIASFGLAAESMYSKKSEHLSQISEIQSKMETLLKQAFPDMQINGENRSPYISNLSFPQMKGEVLVHALAEQGVMVSTGSACSTKKRVTSPVLEAMQVSSRYLEGSIRISYFPGFKEKDIENAAGIIMSVVKKLKMFHS